MNILLTGDPDVRAQVVSELLDELERPVGGLQSYRDEEDGSDIIAMRDLGDGHSTVLAHEHSEEGTEFGKYHIDVEDLSHMARHAIIEAIRRGDMIVIDRIGQVQMHSSTFRESVRDAFRGTEDVLAVVDEEYVDEFQDEGEVLRVDEDNREQVLRQLVHRFTHGKI